MLVHVVFAPLELLREAMHDVRSAPCSLVDVMAGVPKRGAIGGDGLSDLSSGGVANKDLIM